MDLVSILAAIKLVASVVSGLGIIFGVFKVITWIKNKFISIESNVADLKDATSGVRDDIKAQTHAITAELREQRQDFRTFYAPFLLQSQLQAQPQPAPVPVRAKRTRKPVRRKK